MIKALIKSHLIFKRQQYRKVKKILKGSLDLIPSSSLSLKIQIMGGKVCLRCKGKTLVGVVNKLLKKKFLDKVFSQFFHASGWRTEKLAGKLNFKLPQLLAGQAKKSIHVFEFNLWP